MEGSAGLCREMLGGGGKDMGGGRKDERSRWGWLHDKAGTGGRRPSGPSHHGPRKQRGAETNSSLRQLAITIIIMIRTITRANL